MLEKLLKIQTELKCAKNQYNSFGKYNYRSCEDILESVKPYLDKNKCSLSLSDEVVLIGDRFYVKATATLMDTESDKTYSVSAFAREDESKKGMDGSQVTGTASSYARKYALNGLFLIDDTKDADTDEYKRQSDKSDKPKGKKSETYREKVIAYGNEHGIPMSELQRDYNLTGTTTDERFKEVYEHLCKRA